MEFAPGVINWIDAGWAVYKEGVRDFRFFPPLGDREAQRAWLGGVGAAWASDLDNRESVEDALARVLEGRGFGSPETLPLRAWNRPEPVTRPECFEQQEDAESGHQTATC